MGSYIHCEGLGGGGMGKGWDEGATSRDTRGGGICDWNRID